MSPVRKNWRPTGREPDGSFRSSQLVTTFGPGAMVDLVHKAVVVTGLDTWRNEDGHPGTAIKEPRLQEYIATRFRAWNRTEHASVSLFCPPAAGEQPVDFIGIRAVEFPASLICQACNELIAVGDFSLKIIDERHRHITCDAAKPGHVPIAIPARFVLACPAGHLEEFPWRSFVHKQRSTKCGAASLHLHQGSSGDIGDIRVSCQGCGTDRSMLDAQNGQFRSLCKEKTPWLLNAYPGAAQTAEACTQHLQLLVRTASNAYFPVIQSSLSLPAPPRSRIDDLVLADWEDIDRNIRSADDVPGFVKFHGKFSSFHSKDVFSAIERCRAHLLSTRRSLREHEWDQFEALDASCTLDPDTTKQPFAAQKCVPRPAGLPTSISLSLVHRLREVRTLVGFTRISATATNALGDLPNNTPLAALSSEQGGSIRLPAVEIWGEGLFFSLSEDALQGWEKRPEVRAREAKLLRGYETWKSQRAIKGAEFRGIRYYLLHSLSHLLMSAISLECGYAASAIRERMYCRPPEPNTDKKPMAGILLSTGTPGSEGTLGGLVDQHRYMKMHMRKAAELARLCSNDPICAFHEPSDIQSERYLEGAACHGCLHLAECSCESMNQFLDRSLVFPTLNQPQLAFFDGADE